jgi:hypothetical protein
MPSNADLKKALEKANKQVALKDKQISELNAKLSSFFKLAEAKNEESKLQNKLELVIDTIPEEDTITNKTQPIGIKPKSVQKQSEITEVVEVPTDAAVEGPTDDAVEVPTDAVEEKPVIKKKKSRSIWRLYLW